MLNKVVLIGRLVKDPEIKNTSSQVTVGKFTLAVDRKFKNQNGERETDFINCVAWRQNANFIGQYFHKGSKIAIVGNIQTRSYDDNNGKRQYVTEVVVDEADFVESANSQNNPANYSKPVSNNEDDYGYSADDFDEANSNIVF